MKEDTRLDFLLGEVGWRSGMEGKLWEEKREMEMENRPGLLPFFSLRNNMGDSRILLVQVPHEYGLVILGHIGCIFTLQYLGSEVMRARRKFGVFYPDMYAPHSNPKAREFNCVQRGHQNALETYPAFVFCNAIAGVRHPLMATTLTMAWCVGRIAYMRGYATGKPDLRYSYGGTLHWLSLVGSVFLAGTVALDFLIGFSRE